MRRLRIVAAFGLCLVATGLAALDQRNGWTLTVGVVTFLLAVLTMGSVPEDPGAEARAAAKHQARVDEILRRYEERRASGRDPERHP